MEEGESIGKYLKRIREEKGYSLNEIARETNIKIDHLVKIEADDIPDNIPSFYIRGYLKKYCDFLGIDSTDVIEKYDGMHEPEKPKISLDDVGPMSKKGYRPRVKKSQRILQVALVCVLVIAVRCFYYYYLKKKLWTGRGETKRKDKGSAISRTEKKAVDEGGVVTTKKGDLYKYAVSVKAKRNAPIRVFKDGILIWEGVLQAGKTDTWGGKSNVTVALRGPTEVEVFYKDEKVVKKLGDEELNIVVSEKGLEFKKPVRTERED